MLAALIFGGLAYLGRATGSYGFALLLGAPIVTGLVLGRWYRAQAILQVFAGIVLAASVIAAAVMMHWAGVLCGVTFGILIGVPLLVGILVGRLVLGGAARSVPVGAACVVALLIPAEARWLPEPPEETVVTVRTVALPAREAFDRVLFYEDVSATPPTLLRIALPRPLRSEGEDAGVGARRRCVYEKGLLVKEVTEFEPGVRYAFRVVEQSGVEDHSVALRTGSFEFREIDSRHAEVKLATTYRPLLSARELWRPFERAVVERLHEHVLAGMLAGDTAR